MAWTLKGKGLCGDMMVSSYNIRDTSTLAAKLKVRHNIVLAHLRFTPPISSSPLLPPSSLLAAIGSYEKMQYCVTGSGSALITSILDNQVAFKTQPKNYRDLSLEETIDLFKDAFTCAGERDIYCGDNVNYAIITKDGVKFERFALKRD